MRASDIKAGRTYIGRGGRDLKVHEHLGGKVTYTVTTGDMAGKGGTIPIEEFLEMIVGVRREEPSPIR